jgi:N-formylglutamate amidohydrolase
VDDFGSAADGPVWRVEMGDGPLVATAIHDGSAVRAEAAELLALEEEERVREEDPHTALWTSIAPTRIVALRSRFEIDLNRPRSHAVYRGPQDAWGLNVWKTELPSAVVDRSLAAYDAFYREVREVLEQLVARHGRVVVFDLHSYNHRRLGPAAPAADPQGNPDVNVGTGTMDRSRWGVVVDRLIESLGSHDFLGRRLDVRENVRFFGGNFPRWIHENFPDSVCAPAIEVKKFFMDEWTGEVDEPQRRAVGEALQSAAAAVLEALEQP